MSDAYSKDCKKYIHGHSYVVEVFLKSENLDQFGMVTDFKLLKEHLEDLFETWDHAMVVHIQDNRAQVRNIANLLTPFNPTAENMAKYFYDHCKQWFKQTSKVRVHETDTGWAEYLEEGK